MYDIYKIFDLYLKSRSINEDILVYLKKCRILLIKIKILNSFFDLVDGDLLNESINFNNISLNELKDDKKNLKIIKRILYKANKLYINDFEEDFANIIICIKLKDIHISDVMEYYIKKMHSQVVNEGYPYIKPENKIEEYNGQLDTFILRLQK